MKYCVPIDTPDQNGPMADRLGRAAYLLLVDPTADTHTVVPNPGAAAEGGAGIKVAQAIVDAGADVVIAPHVGEHAARILQAAGISSLHAESGRALDLIVAAEAGQLSASAPL